MSYLEEMRQRFDVVMDIALGDSRASQELMTTGEYYLGLIERHIDEDDYNGDYIRYFVEEVEQSPELIVATWVNENGVIYPRIRGLTDEVKEFVRAQLEEGIGSMNAEDASACALITKWTYDFMTTRMVAG